MSIGPLQIVIILVLVLIVFGAGKLPRVMGDIGKGVRNMKEGLRSEDMIKNKDSEDSSEKT